MWERFKQFHANDNPRELQYLRLLYGLMGAALGFFTILGVTNGAEASLQFIVMALLAIVGVVAAVAYTKLLRERASRRGVRD